MILQEPEVMRALIKRFWELIKVEHKGHEGFHKGHKEFYSDELRLLFRTGQRGAMMQVL